MSINILKFRLWVFLIIVTLLPGCKDLLNKEPLASLSESSAYVTSDDAIKAIYAAYEPLLNYRGISGYSLYDIGCDNAEKGGEGPSDGAAFNEIPYFTITASNSVARQAWQTAYLGIRRANLVLENIPDIEMDDNVKQRVLGEARFLRSYHYFILVSLYGDVPLIVDSNIESFEIERSDKELIYNQIISDLKLAIETLPLKSKMPSDELGRVTKGAAKAYLGRVYLFKRDFQEAEKWFKEVVDSKEYELEEDYDYIFTKDAEFGKENIFEVNYIYSPQFRSVANTNSIRQGSAGMYGYGFCNPTQDFIDAFEEDDPRLWQTVYKNGDIMPDGKVADVGNSETGYMSKKVYLAEDEFPPTGDPRNSGKNEILYRYGMLLLWYAEAANENGNTQEALDALNIIRARARQGNSNVLPDVSETSKDQLRTKIYQEQRVEYGMENIRYFDLLRQNRLGAVMTAYSEKYNSNKGKNFREGVNELFPIPQTEIDLSQGSLKQNPGY